MGIGYPGGSFFEEIGPSMSEENLSKLRDNSTEEENKEFKKELLNKIKENLKEEIDPYNEEIWEEENEKYKDFELVIEENKFPVNIKINCKLFSGQPPYKSRMSILPWKNEAGEADVEFMNIEDSVNLIDYVSYNKKNSKLVINRYNRRGLLIEKINLYGIIIKNVDDNKVNFIYDYYEKIYI